MGLFSIDDMLSGLKRGAEKFGGKIAEKTVKKVSTRINGFSPDSAEPYGLGMGGGNTEQETSTPSQALNEGLHKAAPRQLNKLDFLKRELELVADPEEKKLIGEQIVAIEKELASEPNLDPQDHQKKVDSESGKREPEGSVVNEDSGNLGFQSAQKTTTAQRTTNDESQQDFALMQSKCPACGHESESAWNGRCEGCGVKNAGDVSGNVETKENGSPIVEAARNAILAGITPNKIMYSMKEKFPGESESTLQSAADAAFKEIKEDPSHVKENGVSVGEYKGWKIQQTDSNQFWATKGGADATANTLEAVKSKIDEFIRESGMRLNAGHLSPDSWTAAATEERAVWLELAGQDINLATREWPDLSQDVKIQLQDVQDMPVSVNDPGDEIVNSSVCDQCEGSGTDSQGKKCTFCLGSGKDKNMITASNASGLQKHFTFRDTNGEEESVEAADENAAWEKIAHDFATPLADVKKILKLVRTNEKENGAGDALSSRPCSCGHQGNRHFDTGHGEACHNCGCSVYDPTITCRKCGEKEREGVAVGGLCEECQNSKENSADQRRDLQLIKDSEAKIAKLRKLIEDSSRLKYPEETKKWEADLKDEETVLAGLRKGLANDSSSEDVSEIERHVEGIEHELGEMKEGGVNNSVGEEQAKEIWFSANMNRLEGLLQDLGLDAKLAEYRWDDISAGNRDRIRPLLRGEWSSGNSKANSFSNCAGACGCKNQDHMPDANGNTKCPCTCPECQEEKKAYSIENSLDLKNSGIDRGNGKYGSKK